MDPISDKNLENSAVFENRTETDDRRETARELLYPVHMKTSFALAFVVAIAANASLAGATAPSLTAPQIVSKVVESDPWGMGGAEVNAKAVVTEKSGKTRSLVFDAKSRRTAPPLGKSVITFSAPADVAGMKFLQVQNSSSDDERYLYTPDLKRSRRIAGSNRNDSFMGTDFSYADMDARDLRQADSVLKGDEKVGKFDCYHLIVHADERRRDLQQVRALGPQGQLRPAEGDYVRQGRRGREDVHVARDPEARRQVVHHRVEDDGQLLGPHDGAVARQGRPPRRHPDGQLLRPRPREELNRLDREKKQP